MKVIIMYNDDSISEFDVSPGHDAVELDLDLIKKVFAIYVDVGGRTIFSAYCWSNEPKGRDNA